jgi:hypothetical protein
MLFKVIMSLNEFLREGMTKKADDKYLEYQLLDDVNCIMCTALKLGSLSGSVIRSNDGAYYDLSEYKFNEHLIYLANHVKLYINSESVVPNECFYETKINKLIMTPSRFDLILGGHENVEEDDGIEDFKSFSSRYSKVRESFSFWEEEFGVCSPSKVQRAYSHILSSLTREHSEKLGSLIQFEREVKYLTDIKACGFKSSLFSYVKYDSSASFDNVAVAVLFGIDLYGVNKDKFVPRYSTSARDLAKWIIGGRTGRGESRDDI